MKNFKKVIAFTLASVLSLSISVVPGFAEATGSGAKTNDLQNSYVYGTALSGE